MLQLAIVTRMSVRQGNLSGSNFLAVRQAPEPRQRDSVTAFGEKTFLYDFLTRIEKGIVQLSIKSRFNPKHLPTDSAHEKTRAEARV